MWRIEHALSVVRALQPMTRDFNYHLTLGGGVLNLGRSDKDLDLYFLPLCNDTDHEPALLLGFLEELWGKSEPIGSEDCYEEDPRWLKVKFMLNGWRRIDVFVWK
jgi:hypothetical protein